MTTPQTKFYASHTPLAFPLRPNDPQPLKACKTYLVQANSVGFGDRDFLTRADCKAIRINITKGIGMIQPLPRWLMKDPARRIARGVYFVPELVCFDLEVDDLTGAVAAAEPTLETSNA